MKKKLSFVALMLCETFTVEDEEERKDNKVEMMIFT